VFVRTTDEKLSFPAPHLPAIVSRMIDNKTALLIVGTLAIVFLVCLNLWVHRDRKKRGLTPKQAEEEAQSDPHAWWP